jgi:hypothetical protein
MTHTGISFRGEYRLNSNLDHKLWKWNDIRDEYNRAAILVGNGQSIALSDRFKDVSLVGEVDLSLREEIKRLLAALETSSFEGVLGGLLTGSRVAEILIPGPQAPEIVRASYERIKQGLIDAVHSVHVLRSDIDNSVLLRIGEELTRYSAVYSTNYDLTLYWSLMQWADTDGSLDRIRDHFRARDGETNIKNVFDLVRAMEPEADTCVTELFFVHGALHLFQLPSKTVGKLTNNGQGLLDQFYHYPVENSLPLFISEGDSKAKREAIRDSVYLEYVFSRFQKYTGPLVIFGHALGDPDRHLREAISNTSERKLAISIHSGKPDHVVKRKSDYCGYFPNADIQFFDSQTHPLG